MCMKNADLEVLQSGCFEAIEQRQTHCPKCPIWQRRRLKLSESQEGCLTRCITPRPSLSELDSLAYRRFYLS